MKGRLIFVTLVFVSMILSMTGGLYVSGEQGEASDIRAEQLVAMNEIQQLAKQGEYEKMTEKSTEFIDQINSDEEVSRWKNMLFLMSGFCMVYFIIVFSYVYFAILRPFDTLQQFAYQISRGDFDVPLDYERFNYFGEFTWAFDSMRREITKSRACEREAVENNKTVIATLSHDIKTPISSIRAYAEGLEANLDATPEKRNKYLRVIMKKCDEVSGLTDDLFLHSLSDLEKLKINLSRFELCEFLEHAIGEIAAEQDDVKFKKPSFTAMVSADANRLVQVCENLINNSRKYADTVIDVSVVREDDNVEIHFRDYGTGIPDEDMPFIFDKFYRGKNCGDRSGSGLGLYIVKYIVGQMRGRVLLRNFPNGFEAVVSLPIL